MARGNGNGNGKANELGLENEVEAKLRTLIEQANGRCVKFVPDYARGWPDRIILLPGGVLVWVETKRTQDGRLSSGQRVAHLILRRLGQDVRTVWSKEEAEALAKELIHRSERTKKGQSE